MIKKYLFKGIALTMIVTMLTACGSKKEEPTTADADTQSTTREIQPDIPEDDFEVEIEEDIFSPEEICAMYYDYMNGTLDEDEFVETLEALYGKSLDEAEAIFEEHSEEYGYKVYEMSKEIKNSKIGDQIMQVGDVIITFPCTVGELVEKTDAEIVPRKDVKNLYRSFQETGIYDGCESFETFAGSGNTILLKTADGSVLYCTLMSDGELQRASDLYIYQIVTGSSNAFLAGGLHTGLSMEDVNALLESTLNDGFSYGKWEKQSAYNTNNPLLLISVSNKSDRDWDEFPSKGIYMDEVVMLRTDIEGKSLYHLEARFATPYDK